MAADPTDYEMAREYLARCVANPLQAAVGLMKFLDHVRKQERVWFCTGKDIAHHWYRTLGGGDDSDSGRPNNEQSRGNRGLMMQKLAEEYR